METSKEDTSQKFRKMSEVAKELDVKLSTFLKNLNETVDASIKRKIAAQKIPTK
jgi:hypothetical protein